MYGACVLSPVTMTQELPCKKLQNGLHGRITTKIVSNDPKLMQL